MYDTWNLIRESYLPTILDMGRPYHRMAPAPINDYCLPLAVETVSQTFQLSLCK